jgi:hypothetical protein
MIDPNNTIEFEFRQLLQLTEMSISDHSWDWGKLNCKIESVGAGVYKLDIHTYRTPVPGLTEVVRVEILDSKTVWDPKVKYNRTSIRGHIAVNHQGDWVRATQKPTTIQWLPGDFKDFPTNQRI